MRSHPNNFDILRLLAATSVIFSHAFMVTDGSEANEWFVRLSDNQTPLGLVGVFVFFTISGYLVTGSYLADRSAPRYLAKRGLRIFPALLVNLVMIGLLLGPMLSSLPLAQYLTDPVLGQFFQENLALSTAAAPLPGVLFSHTGVGLIVNGALWTLRYEVMMYLMVLGLGWLGQLRLGVGLFLLVLGMVAIRFEKSIMIFGDFGEWAWLVGFFAAGMVWRLMPEAKARPKTWALLAVAGLGISLWQHLFIMMFPLFGGYLTIWLALQHWRWSEPLQRIGDLSYGLYIYGWPIEQAVVWVSHDRLPWWQCFLLALSLTLLAAFLSWHGVEKWALRLVARPRGALVAQPSGSIPG